MTFLKNKKGQALVESLVSLSLTFLISIFGFALIFQGFGTVLIKKWALKNNLCLAQERNPSECEREIRGQVKRYFSITVISVRSSRTHNLITTRITGLILNHIPIQTAQTLYPFEYKRTAQGINPWSG